MTLSHEIRNLRFTYINVRFTLYVDKRSLHVDPPQLRGSFEDSGEEAVAGMRAGQGAEIVAANRSFNRLE